jgi:hypothetical protein
MTKPKICALMMMLAMTVGRAAVAGPPILATSVKADCSYVVTNCSNKKVFTSTSNNGVVITLDPLTNSFWNSKGGSLTYTIYDASVQNVIVQPFACNKATVSFHSASLADSTEYKVIITGPGASSGAYSFTTGTPCKGVPIPKRK